MGDFNLPLAAPRDTKWADGLRGIAAIFVVSSHLGLGYAPYLEYPSMGAHAKPAFYNFPFIRVFGEGVPWVSIFLILTGFVNALKPIKQARAGCVDSALSGLASSCFRRTSRLVLPCTVATVFSWVIAELGGYHIGSLVESLWMNNTCARQEVYFSAAIHQLFKAIYDTWTTSDNIFDRNQWTMLLFLRGSLTLYVTLLATVRATPKYRMAIHAGLFVYAWSTRDTMLGLPIYGGLLLAELSMEPLVIKFSTNRLIVNRLIPFSMLLLGWYLASYPRHNPEWQPWSNTLWHFGMFLFPTGVDVYGYWINVAVLLIIAAVILSTKLQRFLSHPILLWLGAQSFPIYLIHGPLLRSFLNWMLYAFTEPVWYDALDENGEPAGTFPRRPIPPRWKFVVCIPIFYAVVLFLAHIWTLKIESRCGSLTKWLEDTMCGVSDEPAYSRITLQEDRRDEELPTGIVEMNENGTLLPT